MNRNPRWSRRRFLATSSVAAGLSALPLPTTAETPQEGNRIPPPTIITGGIKPLFHEDTARPLRYTPENGGFVIHNGGEFFNRPLYAPISSARVDAGDRPEFSLYLPGHGGNLKLGFLSPKGGGWLNDARDVTATYRPGRMLYRIADRALGTGSIQLELLTAGSGFGLLLKVDAHDLPAGTQIVWAFAGCSGRKGRRNGDIGCEVEPVSQFFQVRPEECQGNRYSVDASAAQARLLSDFCDLAFSFPPGSHLGIEEFGAWQKFPAFSVKSNPKLPVLTGLSDIGSGPIYLTIHQIKPDQPTVQADPAADFAVRDADISKIAGTVTLQTPDAFVDAMGPALGIVADALWDPKQELVMHGCVAWRSALAGWRGPYVLDATGSHERAKIHFRHWLKKQNTRPITTGDPATGPADPNMHLARKEGLLHSNGDLSNNHYDMNMVFFDVLLRHLRWTGDVEFAREIWPAFQRHLAWEKRLFRRVYTIDGNELPLYEAYAAIWASDNLQYSGGGAAHSSAYNVFSFRFAAQLATLLGEDPTPYQHEADLIHEAMQKLLWLPEQGAFAESKDLMEPQTVYNNPALWTVYHAIDSEVPAPGQARQMIAERLAALKAVPIRGEGVPGGNSILPCSDWLPYMWSLNLLLMGENMHFALAMWQAGMPDEAYKIFKGTLLDSMYMGLCPGDFHMTSALDPHRQEAQRDFGDPTGISSRALIEGLFGILPNLIANAFTIRPGFPADWQRASIKHPDFDFAFQRTGLIDTYEFTSRLARQVPVTFVLAARTAQLPIVTSSFTAQVRPDDTLPDAPTVRIAAPASAHIKLIVQWSGATLPKASTPVAKAARAQFAPVPALAAGHRPDPLDLTPVFTHRITEMFAQPFAEPRSPLCTLSVPDTLMGGWANIDPAPKLDDSGLRKAGGMLQTPLDIAFRTPAGSAPNAAVLSFFKQNQPSLTLALTGRAAGLYLLVTGTTLPQCSRMQHAVVTVAYTDRTAATLSLRNPENWWPIEQDYLLDDYLFVDTAPIPPRVSLRTGETRQLTYESFRGKGRTIPGGAATIVHLPLDPAKDLASLRFEVKLYNIVAALLGATLVRPV